MRIKRYVVSERLGSGMDEAKVYDSLDKAEAYVKKRLASHIRDDRADELEMRGINPDDTDVVFAFGKDMDDISGYAYVATSDWHEFSITPIEIELNSTELGIISRRAAV